MKENLTMYNHREKALTKCHHPNLNSIVLHELPDGSLIRVFHTIAEISLGEIAYHTHRYDAAFVVLSGILGNHVLYAGSWASYTFHQWGYTSPLLGGNGLVYNTEVKRSIETQYYDSGTFTLTTNDAHTVSANADTMWLIVEGPSTKQETLVYTDTDVPFDTTGMYQPMSDDTYNETIELFNVRWAACGRY